MAAPLVSRFRHGSPAVAVMSTRLADEGPSPGHGQQGEARHVQCPVFHLEPSLGYADLACDAALESDERH